MSTIHNRPNLSIADAKREFERLFGKPVARVTPLDGERDQNFRVTSTCGDEWVFKICNPDEPVELLHAQNEAMRCVRHAGVSVPEVLISLNGESLSTVETPAGSVPARAVTWVPGVPLAECDQAMSSVLTRIGKMLGATVAALQGFDRPVLRRPFDWNLIEAGSVIRRNGPMVSDEQIRQIIDVQGEAIFSRLSGLGPSLRQSVIHNDANDYNVIVLTDDEADSSPIGLIDFGDIAWSYTVAELAIAMAYVACRSKDWITASCELAHGFTQAFPLTPTEVEALFDLMVLRLLVSVCMNAVQQSERPDDPYLSVSQKPIRLALPIITAARHATVTDQLRASCGIGR